MSYNYIANKTNEMGSAVIYRQEIIQDITLFTSEPKARFYSELFLHLDLSDFPDNVAKTGRKGFSNHAKLRAAVVMKCECFSCIARSDNPKPLSVLVTIKIGTTGRKTRVAQNILPFPTITDFRLTAIVSLSEKSTPSEPKPNATTPVSSKPDRKDYGFTV